MRLTVARLVLYVLMMGLAATACGGVVGESREAQMVESAPAHVEESPLLEAEPSAPLKALSLEDIELTRQARETQDPLLANCAESSGRVERSSYPAFLSNDPIPVILYLPPCYDPYLHVYPVIFLLHGKPQDEQHWLLLGVDTIVTQGIVNGDWPPMLLVMPLQPEPLFSGTDGGPGSLEQELVSGLLPFILDRYAVSGEADQWAIAGISRGGVWALEVSLRNPERFARVAALSPALNVNFPNPKYDLFRILLEAEQLPERIFLGAGDQDSAKEKTLEFASRVEARRITSRYLEVGGTHESATWKQLLPEMLAFLTQGW